MNDLKSLDLFDRQLTLLIKAHREGQEESFGDLEGFENVLAAYDETTLGKDEQTVLGDVKVTFAASINKLREQFEQDIEFLEDQKRAIVAVRLINDAAKRLELVNLLIEDFGEPVTDFAAFEKDLEAQSAEDRGFLKTIVQDLTNMLNEGGFREIEAVLSEFADLEEGEDEDEDDSELPEGDLSDEDLDAVRDAFKKINRPYLTDEENDQDLN